MNIAIVEDLDYDYQQLKNTLEQDELCRRIGIHIDRFKRGEAFLAAFHADKYQIVFLDMLLEGTITGMDAARSVRRLAPSLPIVFTTSEVSFALEGYEVQPLDYLIKPCSPERVSACINRVYSLAALRIYITLQVDRENIRFPADTVAWASSANHSVEVYLDDGRCLKSYITFDAFQKLLPPNSGFVNCSRGLMVNLRYVDFIENGDFVLTDGKTIPISRAKKQQMQSLFNEYQIRSTRGDLL